MTKKEHDLIVFIGRFQPFHKAHKIVVEQALEKAENVLVLVGSDNVAVSPKNPWTYDQRKRFIERCFPYEFGRNLKVRGISDDPYNDGAWKDYIENQVRDVLSRLGWSDKPKKVGIIGYKKDESSYYLDLFPDWDFVQIDRKIGVFDASAIREVYFKDAPYIADNMLPKPVSEYLDSFIFTEQFQRIVEEKKYLDQYKKSWESAPYPPVFVTGDAVVVRDDSVLLIRRKNAPGKGLLALPGGFLDQGESLAGCATRELMEECYVHGLQDKFVRSKVFDHPSRSLRGRVVTVAHLFDLTGESFVYKPEAGDDAASVGWYDIDALEPDQMFEDHWFIMKDLIK